MANDEERHFTFDLVKRFRERDFQLATGNVAYLDWSVVKGGGLRLVRISFDGMAAAIPNR